MPHTHQASNFHYCPHRQRGAALMIMLVIMVVGAATVLVGSLNSSGLRIERDKITADALAQAKEALIGLAVTYIDFPGSLPCPDTDDDGTSDAGGTDECPNYIGRLPWKTLGLADLRDGAGEKLWYTLSRNVRRYASVRPLNSDTPGTLDISGTQVANGMMAIVFAPGSTLAGQNRSNTAISGCANNPSRCASNYLEGRNADPSPGSAPNTNYQSSNTVIPFNDQLISISRDQIFQLVEKRIAREAKACLDSHATVNANTYPWAAPVEKPNHSTTDEIYFGRIPTHISTLVQDLYRLQRALTNYANSTNFNNNTPIQALIEPARELVKALAARLVITTNLEANLHSDVVNALVGPLGTTGIGNDAQDPLPLTTNLNQVKNWAEPNTWTGTCPTGVAVGSSIQSRICRALTLHISKYTSILETFPYTSGCIILFDVKVFTAEATSTVATITPLITPHQFIKGNNVTISNVVSAGSGTYNGTFVVESTPTPTTFTVSNVTSPGTYTSDGTINNYWSDWRNLVFYQIAVGNQPGGGGNCATTSTCLSINNTGSYRAAVAVAGKMLPGQSPRVTTTLVTYLEGKNQLDKTIATPTRVFETHRLSEPQYSTINDLVQCVDGVNICK